MQDLQTAPRPWIYGQGTKLCGSSTIHSAENDW